MRPCLPALLMLTLATPALGEAPPEFAKLRDAAESLDSLTSFLDKYVGECGASLEKRECEANAKKVRAELTGKSFHVILGDAASRMIQAGSFNPATRQYKLQLTPFFEGNGLALTEGAPVGQDANGNPRVPLMPLDVQLPNDWMPMDMDRMIRTGNLKIHLVFRPLGIWTLPGKGKEKLQGVKAKFVALRLTNARTGDEVALRVSR